MRGQEPCPTWCLIHTTPAQTTSPPSSPRYHLCGGGGGVVGGVVVVVFVVVVVVTITTTVAGLVWMEKRKFLAKGKFLQHVYATKTQPVLRGGVRRSGERGEEIRS